MPFGTIYKMISAFYMLMSNLTLPTPLSTKVVKASALPPKILEKRGGPEQFLSYIWVVGGVDDLSMPVEHPVNRKPLGDDISLKA